MKNLKYLKGLSLSIVTAVLIFIGCQAVVEDLTGPSALGNTVGIQGIFGGAGIKNTFIETTVVGVVSRSIRTGLTFPTHSPIFN